MQQTRCRNVKGFTSAAVCVPDALSFTASEAGDSDLKKFFFLKNTMKYRECTEFTANFRFGPNSLETPFILHRKNKYFIKHSKNPHV